VQLVGWTLLTLIIYNTISSFRNYSEALSRTALNVIFIVTFFYGNAKVLINNYYEKRRYGWWLVLTLIFWLSMSALRSWSEVFFYDGSVIDQNIPGQRGQWRTFLIYSLLSFLLLILSALYQFLENRMEVEMRNRELTAMHNEAQLNFLKAQINPHFLFNTLNNIYAAATLNHAKTADMVLKLSDLLRYVTYETKSERVPLEKEMKIVRSVIELYIMCAQLPPDITVEMNGEVNMATIEPMLLLPVVENALKHGNMGDDDSGFMRVRVDVNDTSLHFEVINSYDPLNRQKDHTGGVGLANIRSRLRLQYPDKHQLVISPGQDTYTVSVKIQYHRRA